eukprot:scaffold551807_cov17-Prasinocladus_malaysianus.AAC.1
MTAHAVSKHVDDNHRLRHPSILPQPVSVERLFAPAGTPARCRCGLLLPRMAGRPAPSAASEPPRRRAA